jgi:hypothetical protein
MACHARPWYEQDQWKKLLWEDEELWDHAMKFYKDIAGQSKGGCFTPCPPFHRICARSCSEVPWYEMKSWKSLLTTNRSFRAKALEYFKRNIEVGESGIPDNHVKLH